MREWDFSDWYSEPPELEKWLHGNLSALLNEVADGHWTCHLDDVGMLRWINKAEGDARDGEALVNLSAENFKQAILFRLTQDYPVDDGAIWPSHREDIHEQWHRMRAAWWRALDDIDRAVGEVLALPDREEIGRR